MAYLIRVCQRLIELIMMRLFPSPLLRFVLGVFLASASPLLLAQEHFELDNNSRTGMAMTIFNSNLAVVRDRREVVLPKGQMELEITDIAMTLVPSTVSLTSSQKKGFVADRQNYRFDLLNRQSMLERFLGRKLKYSRFVLEGTTFEKVLREGILLSINPEIVKFGDVIEVEPEGTISLPYIPDDLKTTPTLVFKGDNGRQGRQALDIRYHVTGIEWTADYSLTMSGQRGDLDGWVTIENHSAYDFDVDQLRLVAGDLNAVAPQQKRGQEMARMSMMDSAAPASLPSQAVGESHAYSVPGTVRLLKNDMTQLRMLAASDIKIIKNYRLESHAQQYGNQAIEERRPSTWISFVNSRKNNLNLPLAAGRVRVYESDDDMETFVGGGVIGHKAAGEEIELELGRTFDLTSRRMQTEYRRLGERAAEVGYRIEIMSAKQQSSVVTVREHLSGDWELVSASQKGRKLSGSIYEFDVKIPAGGSASVDYQVRFKW